MDDETVLIDEARLRAVDPELRRRIEPVRAQYAIDPDDAVWGAALRYALLFERWPDLLGADLTPLTRFYNRYYWLLRLAKLYETAHGFDFGLEQQTHQLLERADSEVDWLIVERVHRKVLDELGIDADF